MTETLEIKLKNNSKINISQDIKPGKEIYTVKYKKPFKESKLNKDSISSMIPKGLTHVRTILANGRVDFLLNDSSKQGEIYFNVLFDEETIQFEISEKILKQKSISDSYRYLSKLFTFGYSFVENPNSYLQK